MVADPRATSRADAVRSLNRPRPVVVRVGQAADGAVVPVTIDEGGQRRAVTEVEEIWLVEDEWWHRRIARRYYRVVLAGGAVRTIFYDLTDDAWYVQRY